MTKGKLTKVEDIERRIEICREYAKLWEEFFKCFGTGEFRDRKVLEQEEIRFEKLLVELTRALFRFDYFMGDRFSDGGEILEILEQAAGLKALQQMSEANFQRLEMNWHSIFINMHRAEGRLLRELPPDEPEEEEEKGGKKKKKGKGAKAPKAAARPKATARPSAPRPGSPASPKLGAPSAPKLGASRPSGPPRPKGP